MFRRHRLQAALSAVFAVVQLAPSTVTAQEFPDRDTREIRSYVLTEYGFAQYTQATRNPATIAASWGLSQPGSKLAPGASMANVNSYRAHEAAIQKLGEQRKSDDCGDNRDSEEQE